METRDSTPVPSICCDAIWWFLWCFEVFVVWVHVALLSIFETMTVNHQHSGWMAQPIGNLPSLQPWWCGLLEWISKQIQSTKWKHHLHLGTSWDQGHIPAFLQDQTSSSLPKKMCVPDIFPHGWVFFFCLSGVFPRIQHMVSSFLCKGRIWISIGMFISFWHTIPLSWTGCSWGSCYFIYHCGPNQLALSIPDEQNREAILENLDSALVELWTLKIS